jgi:hypothetical protein
MRSNNKLPRGSFFYIQVGPKFYAGKAPVKTEVKTHAVEMRPRMGGYFGRWGATYRGFQPNKPHCQPVLMASYTKGEVITVHTGEFTNIMVDSKDGAKQFRRLSQAETICAELTKAYADIGAKPVIHTHTGDTR